MLNLTPLDKSQHPDARNGTVFLVSKDDEPVGLLKRLRGDRYTTYPWQSKKFTGTTPCPATGEPCYESTLVTSVYPDGKGRKASNAAKTTALEALEAAL